MFRKMRRIKQQLSREDCEKILLEGKTGVLAVAGDDGYPYAVPLNYVYDKTCDKIFFHSAVGGYKLDAIAGNPKVSFCVVGAEDVVPEKYTTYFSSVICFGRARVLTEEEEVLSSLRLLADKYVQDGAQKRDAEIRRFWNEVRMVEISVEHMTGKCAIELTER